MSTAQIIETLYEEHLSELTATVKAELISLLSKDLKKELKQSMKKTREPKTDEEGNVVKKPLNQGMIQWREFYTYIQKKLIELTGNDKVSLKECICVGSILKKTGHYPESNLTDEVIVKEYNSWISLSAEDQKLKREQLKVSSSVSHSEAEATEDEKPKAKPRASSKAKAKAVAVEEVKAVVVEEVKEEPNTKSVTKKQGKKSVEKSENKE